MRELFKNRFFIICLAVAVLLAAVPSVLSLVGFADPVKNVLGVVTSPFAKLFNIISDGFEGFTDYFIEFDRLKDENEELKARIASMESEINDARQLEAENTWLYGYLGLRRVHTDFSLAKASVTGRSSGNYLTTFTLDRGTSSGIDVDMPVITEDGVVGSVCEVGLTWCKVIAITETESSVGAYVSRSEDVGVIEGEFALRSEGLCRLSYLEADADVEEGDDVLTSGLGEIYPRGLKVGRVTSVVLDPASRTKSAVVKPAVDFSSLGTVMVITSYTAYEE